MKTLKMNTERIIPILLVLLPVMVLLIIAGCSCPVKKEETVTKEPPQSFVVHPEWSRNATIYEVNIRQFTPEGTFQAFTAHIPRLKKMGDRKSVV